jgi:hypothetical protein
MSCHPLLAQLYRELRAQAPNVPARRALLEAKREAMLREAETAERIRFEWDDDEDAWWVVTNLDPSEHPHAERRWETGAWQVLRATAARRPFCWCCGKRHRLGFTEWDDQGSLGGVILTSDDDLQRRQVERDLAADSGLFDDMRAGSW